MVRTTISILPFDTVQTLRVIKTFYWSNNPILGVNSQKMYIPREKSYIEVYLLKCYGTFFLIT